MIMVDFIYTGAMFPTGFFPLHLGTITDEWHGGKMKGANEFDILT